MLADAVRDFLRLNRLGFRRILAAVSGGGDSTALLLVLAKLREEGVEVVCGHVNHHLRGADSNADEAFVRGLCESLNVELHRRDAPLDAAELRRCGVPCDL